MERKRCTARVLNHEELQQGEFQGFEVTRTIHWQTQNVGILIFWQIQTDIDSGARNMYDEKLGLEGMKPRREASCHKV